MDKILSCYCGVYIPHFEKTSENTVDVPIHISFYAAERQTYCACIFEKFHFSNYVENKLIW